MCFESSRCVRSWDRDLIEDGHRLVRERLAAVAAGGPAPGRYQLLAAINAVHTDARDTDWSQMSGHPWVGLIASSVGCPTGPPEVPRLASRSRPRAG